MTNIESIRRLIGVALLALTVGGCVGQALILPDSVRAAAEKARPTTVGMKLGVGRFQQLAEVRIAEGGHDIAGSGYDYADEFIEGVRAAGLFTHVVPTNDPDDPEYAYVITGTPVPARPGATTALTWKLDVRKAGKRVLDETVTVAVARDPHLDLTGKPYVVWVKLDDDQTEFVRVVGQYAAWRLAPLESGPTK